MRGCFRSKAVGDEGSFGEKYRDIPLWVDSNTKEVCDNYKGSYCKGRESICRDHKAPGGLADFTHPMSVEGEKFLKYGFVAKQCECTMNQRELDDQPVKNPLEKYYVSGRRPTKYTCWYNKRSRGEGDGLIKPDGGCCQPEDNKKCIQEGWNVKLDGGCSDFWYPGNDYTPCKMGSFGVEINMIYIPVQLYLYGNLIHVMIGIIHP